MKITLFQNSSPNVPFLQYAIPSKSDIFFQISFITTRFDQFQQLLSFSQ
ncbi:hypothetical protein pb186bvf_021203, partial [Paramecium bursaria]